MDRPIENRPLYLLVEETNRELASRALIATVAVNAGLTSYILPQWFAWEHAARLPAGVFLFKGNNHAQSTHMVAARQAGHRVAAIEEEILGVTDPSEIFRLFHPAHIDACELFLLQGDHAQDLLASRFPGTRARMTVTGNPRTDLLRPPLDGAIRRRAFDLREAHGDFILINTNFASINPRIEDAISYYEMCARVGVIDPESAEDRTQFFKWCTWERQNMALLAKVITACKANEALPKIILRPHPSENLDRWREAYPDDDRMSLIREGEHTAWTAAARLLLHTGCTTGVEAILLGTPVLSLQGGVSEWHGAHTSNFVNQTAGSVEEAMTKINSFFTGDDAACAPTTSMVSALERQLLPSGDGTAAERIAAALSELARDQTVEDGSRPPRSGFSQQVRLASEHKIDSAEFTPNVVGALAKGFAAALGYAGAPAVNGIGDGMIKVSRD
ncbi:MAG: hypothetical protein P8N43_08165 [Alphaproteobacteria bacterium]|nr:hypothetical protein [Alphaproteobacteria bacterium]